MMSRGGGMCLGLVREVTEKKMIYITREEHGTNKKTQSCANESMSQSATFSPENTENRDVPSKYQILGD